MPDQHARIGPSALARLIACPGSFNLVNALPAATGSTSYAARGHVAHAISEDVLKGGVAPDEGDVIHNDGHDVEIDAELLAAVELYVSTIETVTAKVPVSGRFWIESQVSLDKLWAPGPAPEPVWGTADFVAWDPASRHLDVVDFKAGSSRVDPYENAQAMAYGLGAILTHDLDPLTVTLTIVQPRHEARPVKEWSITGLDLRMWGREVLMPAVRAVLDADAPLASGTHCFFCPASPSCPALAKRARDNARLEFGAAPPDAGTLSDAELAVALDDADVVEHWIRAVRGEASRRIDSGGRVPGWKLAPKRAMRRWTGKLKDVLTAAGTLGLPSQVFLKETLHTPAQVEKNDPDAYQVLVDHNLIEKSSSGSTLVREADAREAAPAARSAKAQFSMEGTE